MKLLVMLLTKLGSLRISYRLSSIMMPFLAQPHPMLTQLTLTSCPRHFTKPRMNWIAIWLARWRKVQTLTCKHNLYSSLRFHAKWYYHWLSSLARYILKRVACSCSQLKHIGVRPFASYFVAWSRLQSSCLGYIAARIQVDWDGYFWSETFWQIW
jgi:hypothetical protein